VVLNERGSVPRFTCAFHGWQFGCNGKLERITDERTFNPKLIAHRPIPPTMPRALVDQTLGPS